MTMMMSTSVVVPHRLVRDQDGGGNVDERPRLQLPLLLDDDEDDGSMTPSLFYIFLLFFLYIFSCFFFIFVRFFASKVAKIFYFIKIEKIYSKKIS